MMLSRLYRPAVLESLNPVRLSKPAVQARFVATVENTRQMPDRRQRATPISHDRATFTIRVSHSRIGSGTC